MSQFHSWNVNIIQNTLVGFVNGRPFIDDADVVGNCEKNAILISFEIRYSRVQSLDSITVFFVMCFQLSECEIFLSFLPISPSLYVRARFIHCEIVAFPIKQQTMQTQIQNNSSKYLLTLCTVYKHTHIQTNVHLNFLVTLQYLRELLFFFGIVLIRKS